MYFRSSSVAVNNTSSTQNTAVSSSYLVNNNRIVTQGSFRQITSIASYNSVNVKRISRDRNEFIRFFQSRFEKYNKN